MIRQCHDNSACAIIRTFCKYRDHCSTKFLAAHTIKYEIDSETRIEQLITYLLRQNEPDMLNLIILNPHNDDYYYGMRNVATD
jgi:hypothetical protein